MVACSTGNSTAPTGDFTVTAGLAAAATLGTTDTFHVTVQSTNGFAGQVLLTFAGVPPDWVVSLSQNPVTVAANGSAGSTVSITIPTNGTPKPAGDTVTVRGTGFSRNHTALTTVTVTNEMIIPIVLGADTLKHFGSFSSATVHLNTGTTISVLNQDTTPHLIHYDGGLGLAHQAIGPGLSQGQKYSQVVSVTGSDILRCHLHAAVDSVILVSP